MMVYSAGAKKCRVSSPPVRALRAAKGSSHQVSTPERFGAVTDGAACGSRQRAADPSDRRQASEPDRDADYRRDEWVPR